MLRIIVILIFVGILLPLILPVLVAQFRGEETRRFEWVKLENTSFQEIAFPNLEQNLNLAGMLIVPEGEGPFPAAVIIGP